MNQVDFVLKHQRLGILKGGPLKWGGGWGGGGGISAIKMISHFFQFSVDKWLA